VPAGRRPGGAGVPSAGSAHGVPGVAIRTVPAAGGAEHPAAVRPGQVPRMIVRAMPAIRGDGRADEGERQKNDERSGSFQHRGALPHICPSEKPFFGAGRRPPDADPGPVRVRTPAGQAILRCRNSGTVSVAGVYGCVKVVLRR